MTITEPSAWEPPLRTHQPGDAAAPSPAPSIVTPVASGHSGTWTPGLGQRSAVERRARFRRLSLWRDGLVAATWLTAVGTTALFLASGALVWTAPVDAVLAAGRLTGLIATVLIMGQMVLASRAPYVERAIGHDRAATIHGKLGEPVFYLLLAHAALLAVGVGAPQGRGLLAQTDWYLTHDTDIALSILSFALLTIVVVTSIAAVRRRWPYETWHAIHLFTYVAIGLAVPHQFTQGSTFRYNTFAWWFWVALYAVSVGSLVIWRMIAPIARAVRHGLRVTQIDRHDDGTISVVMSGRHLEDWMVRPGQFFIWRFLTPSLWATAHPYSLSAAPDGSTLRITVKPLGDDSAALSSLRPGVRVIAEGPYGRFHHAARVGRGLVLVGAGVGLTPIRAMLEDEEVLVGPTTVIVRARSHRDAPLLDEIRVLAARAGATLYEVIGPRGRGWATDTGSQSLSDYVPDLASADVFACGPRPWAESLRRDSVRHGVKPEAFHVEEFAW